MKQIEAILDTNNNAVVGLENSDYVYTALLAANTATIVNVAATTLTEADVALFSGSADFYVRFNATAAVASSVAVAGSGSILNPSLRGLTDVTKITLISGEACKVSVEFFKK